MAFEGYFIREWNKSISQAFVEFVLELDPMETKNVEEAFKRIHAHEDTESETDPHEVTNPDLKIDKHYK